jgi:hypothetical protein
LQDELVNESLVSDDDDKCENDEDSHLRGMVLSDNESIESINSEGEPTSKKENQDYQKHFSGKFDIKKFTNTENKTQETSDLKLLARNKVKKELEKMERVKRLNKNLLEKTNFDHRKMAEKGILSAHRAMEEELDAFKNKVNKKISMIKQESLRE